MNVLLNEMKRTNSKNVCGNLTAIDTDASSYIANCIIKKKHCYISSDFYIEYSLILYTDINMETFS